MPELPEVEIISKQLHEELVGCNMSIDCILDYQKYIKSIEPIESLVLSVERINKTIIIETEKYGILMHLGMTGNLRLLLKLDSKQLKKHDHFIIHIHNKIKKYLIFNDIRKFGKFEIHSQEKIKNIKSNLYKKYGLDIYKLQNNISITIIENIYNQIKKTNKSIYSTILDGTIIAGLGNIYANEALFLSKIMPSRASNTLSMVDVENIINNSILLFNLSVSLGGSSIKDYTDIYQTKGTMPSKYNCYMDMKNLAINVELIF